MKGYLRCFEKEYGYDHNLEELLDAVNNLVKLPTEINEYILNLNRYKSRLRYRNMTTDPTAEDAKTAISRTKIIMDEFAKNTDISSYIKEAKEVHSQKKFRRSQKRLNFTTTIYMVPSITAPPIN